MYLSTMAEWLTWMTSLHHGEIELGLERIREVAKPMNLLTFDCPVVIVGGTNGKGSTVAGLESIYRASGRHVGAFTSPVLFKQNEQVRIDGENPSDETFCRAFLEVESKRGDISLTPFEFQTLAALWIFKIHKLDILILEVGLGGRLDAVNIIDPDISVVTSIGIDHVEYLGPTREHIGFEKAGIFRAGRPAVCGDFDPPVSLLTQAEKLGTQLYCQGKEFGYEATTKTWSFHRRPRESGDPQTEYSNLPLPRLALQNMSIVLMVVTLLQQKLPVTRDAIDNGLKNVTLIGRQQIIPGSITEIYDVSHNIDSVRWLSEKIKKLPCSGKTIAVFSMLSDKDIAGCIHLIKEQISAWYVAPLAVKRGASDEKLREIFSAEKIQSVSYFNTIATAYTKAKAVAEPGDRIIVFGSFHTIAEIQLQNSDAPRLVRGV